MFVGTIYWYLYITGERAIEFGLDPINSAMEAGGPMRSGPGRNHRYNSDANTVIEGQDPSADTPNGAVGSPMRSGHLMSSLAKDLSDNTPYAKTHAERMAEQNGTNEKV